MTPMDRLHDTQYLSRSRKLLAGVLTFWMTLLFSHGVQAAGEVLADPNAAVRPGIGTQNNVPIVNIVEPDAQGLSHNRYLQFNIPAQGLVFNNSLQAGTSGLAGDLGANPNFNGQAASLILNEVTGFNPSQLLGRGEVFGSAARLIIANPNGIYASGRRLPEHATRDTDDRYAAILGGNTDRLCYWWRRHHAGWCAD